ncbi:acyltransferase [Luminiphilus sp.]|nr:acyltransferase [Luminiphilus sp.]
MKIYNAAKYLYFKCWLILNLPNCFLKGVKVASNIELRGFLVIRNKGVITISENARINSSKNINPIGGGWNTHLQCLEGASIIIDKGARLSNVSLTAKKSVYVGKGVYIGDGAGIFDTDFHPLSLVDRLGGKEGDSSTRSEPVVIEDGAFIGSRSIILKGVRVGARSVIGAGSVVTKSIPADEIWAGNPARYIKDLC